MRIALTIPLLLLAAGCNVSKNGNSVTVQYDQNTAENTAAAIGNTAQNIGGDIVNDVQKTGNKIENTNVDLKVGNNEQSNSTATTKTTTKTEKKNY